MSVKLASATANARSSACETGVKLAIASGGRSTKLDELFAKARSGS